MTAIIAAVVVVMLLGCGGVFAMGGIGAVFMGAHQESTDPPPKATPDNKQGGSKKGTKKGTTQKGGSKKGAKKGTQKSGTKKGAKKGSGRRGAKRKR